MPLPTGTITLTRCNYERATRLLGYTDAVYGRAGFTREPTEHAGYVRTLETLQEALPSERLNDLLGRGGDLDRARAVTLAQASAL